MFHYAPYATFFFAQSLLQLDVKKKQNETLIEISLEFIENLCRLKSEGLLHSYVLDNAAADIDLEITCYACYAGRVFADVTGRRIKEVGSL